jgi:hypothetical protein
MQTTQIWTLNESLFRQKGYINVFIDQYQDGL